MKRLVLIFGSVYGLLSVVFGAFGAHVLKHVLTADKLLSFETGVKYQMYHALLLLLLGFFFDFVSRKQRIMAWSIIFGVFLFSFSIYLLILSSLWSINLSSIAMLTPLGGIFLITGWVLLLFIVSSKK